MPHKLTFGLTESDTSGNPLSTLDFQHQSAWLTPSSQGTCLLRALSSGVGLGRALSVVNILFSFKAPLK